MENVQSKRKYNFDHDGAATKGKYYCSVIYMYSLYKILITTLHYVAIRLDEKDKALLQKVLSYSQSIYDETLAAREAADESKKAALEAKEAALRTESAINEYFKEQSMQEKDSEDSEKLFSKSNKKKAFWYTVNISHLLIYIKFYFGFIILICFIFIGLI